MEIKQGCRVEASPAWTQDQLYLHSGLDLSIVRNGGARASSCNLLQCLISFVLARSCMVWCSLAGREDPWAGNALWARTVSFASLLHITLLCVWWLLQCCLLSTFFFRLINCGLSSEVTFSRPLIFLGAYLCPPSSWATHWLRHGAQMWMQTPMKPLQCQVQWEGLFQMSCFFPVHTPHYGVSFSCICRTILNLVWCVWSITTSEVFSPRTTSCKLFPSRHVQLINPNKVCTLLFLSQITFSVK